MNKWDIVFISFPFTDQRGAKRRPGLIISPEPTMGEDTVVIAITSNLNNQGQYDVPVLPTFPEFSLTGLSFPSRIQVDKIFTFKKTLVTSIIGRLGPLLQSHVDQQLRRFLSL